MKNLFLIVVLFTSTITVAQESLFKSISTTEQYTEYSSVKDEDGDGFYTIQNKYAIVKFDTEYLPTGEGYKINALVDIEGKHMGSSRFLLDARDKDAVCKGYPYESFLTGEKGNSFVAVGDYAFLIGGLKKDGTFNYIESVFIKNGAKTPAGEVKKKKKTFRERLAALKKLKSGITNYGPEHKALQKQNLNKMISDYLAIMKAKQDARTGEELKGDKNLEKAKAKVVSAEKDEWAAAKRYNDSVKATPEWKDLERRKAQNEANYKASQTRTVVTLRNTTGSTIYVGKSGSRNPGTKINAGGTASWDCRYDAYLQIEKATSSNRSYTTTKTKVYSANSSCGGNVNVN